MVDLVIDIKNTPGALARVATAISDSNTNGSERIQNSMIRSMQERCGGSVVQECGKTDSVSSISERPPPSVDSTPVFRRFIGRRRPQFTPTAPFTSSAKRTIATDGRNLGPRVLVSPYRLRSRVEWCIS